MYRFVVILFLSATHAQLLLDGACDFSAISYDKTLNITGTQGTWYEIKRIPNSFEKGECAHANISLIFSGTSLTEAVINHSEVAYGNGTVLQRKGTIVGSSAIINITYNDGNSQNYVVLGLDGNNYLTLYTCANAANNTRSVTAWVYGRTTTLNAAAKNATDELIEGNSDLVNATWKTVSFTEDACRSKGVNFHSMSSVILLLIGLALAKE